MTIESAESATPDLFTVYSLVRRRIRGHTEGVNQRLADSSAGGRSIRSVLDSFRLHPCGRRTRNPRLRFSVCPCSRPLRLSRPVPVAATIFDITERCLYGVIGKSWCLRRAAAVRVYGYIDKAGALVIPSKFLEATRFAKGLAHVRIGRDRYAWIGANGEIVFTYTDKRRSS
jgi:hypothetical protein